MAAETAAGQHAAGPAHPASRRRARPSRASGACARAWRRGRPGTRATARPAAGSRPRPGTWTPKGRPSVSASGRSAAASSASDQEARARAGAPSGRPRGGRRREAPSAAAAASVAHLPAAAPCSCGTRRGSASPRRTPRPARSCPGCAGRGSRSASATAPAARRVTGTTVRPRFFIASTSLVLGARGSPSAAAAPASCATSSSCGPHVGRDLLPGGLGDDAWRPAAAASAGRSCSSRG